jgi:hypothetical protein
MTACGSRVRPVRAWRTCLTRSSASCLRQPAGSRIRRSGR